MSKMEVTICGAENLKCAWHSSVLQPFAVAYVDKNEKFSTKADLGKTLSIPLGAPIDDDTTLKVDMFDARNEDARSKIGSASLKLKEVVSHVGYGKHDQRTLQLKFITGRSHGDVLVDVLIEEPGIAEPDGQPPDGQPPKKTSKFVEGAIRGLAVGAALNKDKIAETVKNIGEIVKDIGETVKDGLADLF
ncbi:hypothetical protein SLA2020_103400 [Shorea laevis]